MKRFLSNAEQHPLVGEQGDRQRAGAGLGPLGSPKEGDFEGHLTVVGFFPPWTLTVVAETGAAVPLWSLGWM